ncbi:hypothetical protein [Pseudomonas sp. TSRC2-2]|uniref:hypothetical protein n=1 Tax=unclassified Pseudomonas TaxID=196821 RepID=UPI003CEAFD27
MIIAMDGDRLMQITMEIGYAKGLRVIASGYGCYWLCSATIKAATARFSNTPNASMYRRGSMFGDVGAGYQIFASDIQNETYDRIR